MKAYIRSLSIEERKTYVSAISYTFFQSMSCLLVKIMISWYKIKSLTLICEGGSIISVMCICRIIISIRNKKTKSEEVLDINRNKWVLLNAVVNCLCLVFAMFSLVYTSISTYTLIQNQSSILTIFLSHYFLQDEIRKDQTIWYVLMIISCVIVISPLLSKSYEEFLGIVLALLATAALSLSHIVNRKTTSSQIDTLILFIGIYSAAFGCFAIVIFTNEVGEINIFYWLLILLKSFMTYYMIIFQIKAVRDLKNANKLIPFSLLSNLSSLILGVYLFNLNLNVNDYIGYGFTFLFIYVVSTKIMQPSKMNQLIEYGDYEYN